MYVIWLKWVCNIDKITFWRFLTAKKKSLEIQNAFVFYFLDGNAPSLYEYAEPQSHIPDKVFQWFLLLY